MPSKTGILQIFVAYASIVPIMQFVNSLLCKIDMRPTYKLDKSRLTVDHPHDYNPDFPHFDAIDGDLSTSMDCAGTAPLTVTVHLEGTFEVVAVCTALFFFVT